ncbi:PadR family transcriptional regulator [Acidaminobacter sp. JC074]|uniref:PadR family transcriptional regulator n=1 Tax=Acidaminobacter sp. JC074 TaxID=2530199 RepID=UPI001F0DBABA|nr:PadR family transcriptional regulator [Acidaminobacter sp. JC074]MCH4889998.1 PadR family transcriptional regulator [Acidaminobacter sp. JC074]
MNTQFKKGLLDLCVLSILHHEDAYGYEIANKVMTYMEISEGSIYPLLRRFKKDEYVTSYLQESLEGPPRKYYKLTHKGQTIYKELLNEWHDFQSSINMLLKEG